MVFECVLDACVELHTCHSCGHFVHSYDVQLLLAAVQTKDDVVAVRLIAEEGESEEVTGKELTKATLSPCSHKSSYYYVHVNVRRYTV